MAIHNSYKPEFYAGKDLGFARTIVDSFWRRDERYQVNTYPICYSPP